MTDNQIDYTVNKSNYLIIPMLAASGYHQTFSFNLEMSYEFSKGSQIRIYFTNEDNQLLVFDDTLQSKLPKIMFTFIEGKHQ